MTREGDIAGGDTAGEGRDLWAVAWEWLWNAIGVFGEPGEIAAAGLTERVGLRLRAWLWSLEAIVRRLMLAAALRLPPRSPATGLPANRSPANASARTDNADAAGTRAPGAAFRFFRFRSGLCTTAAMPAAAAASASPAPAALRCWFGGDALLRLGSPRRRPAHAARPARRRLTRAMALMYGLADPEEEEARSNRYWFGGRDPHPEEAQRAVSKDETRSAVSKDRQSRDPAPVDHWLIDLDNTMPVAMPALGRRLAALRRIMENPLPAVRRLAGALRRRGNLFIALQDQEMAAPKPGRPRVFDAPVPPVQDAVRRSGFVLANTRLDSS